MKRSFGCKIVACSFMLMSFTIRVAGAQPVIFEGSMVNAASFYDEREEFEQRPLPFSMTDAD